MGSKSKPKAPDYTPVANASEKSAEYGLQATRERLAFDKEMFGVSQQQYEELKPLFEQITNNQLAAQDQQMAQAGQYSDYLRDTYLPLTEQQMGLQMDAQRQQSQQSQELWDRQQKFFGLEDQIVADAQRFNTQAKQQEYASKARSAYEQGFAQQDAATERQLMAMGVNPNSGKFASEKRKADVMQGALTAQGMTKASQDAEALAYSHRMDGAALGRGLSTAGTTSAQVGLQAAQVGLQAGQAGLQAGQSTAGLAGQMGQSYLANPYAGAISAGNSAGQNAMMAGNNFFSQGMSVGQSMQGAYGLGQTGLNTQVQGLSSVLGAQTDVYGQQVAANASAMQGLGSAVGMIGGMAMGGQFGSAMGAKMFG